MPTITTATSTTHTLDRFSGQAGTGGVTVSRVSRPAVDGELLRRQAKKPGMRTWQSLTAVATNAAVKSTLLAYQALQGQSVTIVDEFGNTHAGVVVLRVVETESKAIGKSTGFAVASPVAILRCEWDMQFREVTA